MTTITVQPIPDLTRASERLQKPENQIRAAMHDALQYLLTYGLVGDNPPKTIDVFHQYDGEILAVYTYEGGRKFVMGGIPRPERIKRNEYGSEYFEYSFHS